MTENGSAPPLVSATEGKGRGGNEAGRLLSPPNNAPAAAVKLHLKVLGVDPGVHGGLAIVRIGDGVAPQIIDIIDVPTVGVGAKERVDAIAVHNFIEAHRPDHAVIERAQAMPKQGASSGFKYGRAVGALEAVIACCAVPLTVVEPTAWKKFHQLHGGEKEASRQRALQLFPSAHTLLSRKKDHGRAEAALLALVPIVTPFAALTAHVRR